MLFGKSKIYISGRQRTSELLSFSGLIIIVVGKVDSNFHLTDLTGLGKVEVEGRGGASAAGIKLRTSVYVSYFRFRGPYVPPYGGFRRSDRISRTTTVRLKTKADSISAVGTPTHGRRRSLPADEKSHENLGLSVRYPSTREIHAKQ